MAYLTTSFPRRAHIKARGGLPKNQKALIVYCEGKVRASLRLEVTAGADPYGGQEQEEKEKEEGRAGLKWELT